MINIELYFSWRPSLWRGVHAWWEGFDDGSGWCGVDMGPLAIVVIVA